MKKLYILLSLVSLLGVNCQDDLLESDEGFSECDSSSLLFFQPTNRTFITPAKSDFIDTLCIPLEIEGDLSFIDLSATKVCLLEQHFGLIAEYLSKDRCNAIVLNNDLDKYYYQYVGLSLNQQEYIFINAFQSEQIDTFDWKREPFVANCNEDQSHWNILFNLEELSFSEFHSDNSKKIFYVDEFPYENLGCARCISIQDLETFAVSQHDICLMMEHMHKLEDIKSTGCYSRNNMVDLSMDWLLQYTGVQKNDHKWIYINAMYASLSLSNSFYLEFLPSVSSVCDGGTAFWGVLFDLESFEFLDLQFNNVFGWLIGAIFFKSNNTSCSYIGIKNINVAITIVVRIHCTQFIIGDG